MRRFNQDDQGGRPVADSDGADSGQVEAEAAHKIALLALVLDNIDQGVALFDADGRQALANRRFCELLELPLQDMGHGVPLQDIIRRQEGRGDFDDVPDEVRERVRRWSDGETGEPTVTFDRRRWDGRRLRICCTRLPDGGQLRTYADVTALVRAETQAAEAREHLDTVLANIDQGIILRDAADKILLFNQRLSELLNVPVELYRRNASSDKLAAYHRTQAHLPAPEDAARLNEWLARRIKGKPVERLEYRREGEGGRHLNVVFQPLADGQELRTFTDVTATRSIELQLIEHTGLLDAVLDAVPQGILATDAGDRVTHWNRRAGEILDVAPATLDARPGIGELLEAGLAEQVRNGQAGDAVILECRLPDGRRIGITGRRLAYGRCLWTLADQAGET